MTFISYAQNFEDIRLWRALKYVENGFYIDIGANDPTQDSVTKAFYDHGWSGINVEPMSNYYDALCQQRPKDINLQCVAGESADDLIFYGIAGTGLSTLDPALAQQHKDAGMDVRSQTVKSRTLASICEQHARNRPIHFLKIDVEGHEETVLRGMDFTNGDRGSSSSKLHGSATRPGKPSSPAPATSPSCSTASTPTTSPKNTWPSNQPSRSRRATWTTSSSAKATTSATPSPIPKTTSPPPCNAPNTPKRNCGRCKTAEPGKQFRNSRKCWFVPDRKPV